MEDDFLKGKRRKVYLRLRRFLCNEGKEQQKAELPSQAPTHSCWRQPWCGDCILEVSTGWPEC